MTRIVKRPSTLMIDGCVLDEVLAFDDPGDVLLRRSWKGRWSGGYWVGIIEWPPDSCNGPYSAEFIRMRRRGVPAHPNTYELQSEFDRAAQMPESWLGNSPVRIVRIDTPEHAADALTAAIQELRDVFIAEFLKTNRR